MSTPPPLSASLTALLRRLDSLLFEVDDWFLIDRHQVKTTEAATLPLALAAVAAGDGAAVVGRLAPGVAAVDVDAGSTAGPVVGDAIAEQLAGWLTARGRWHLVRPSGGGPGRWHVFCVPGDDDAALAAYVSDLRTTYGVSGRDVDHRGAGGGAPWLRPLSSPHRTSGRVPRPLGTHSGLREALSHLRALLGPPRSRTRLSAPERRADRAARAHRREQREAVALVPLPRRRRPVAPAWQAWLRGAPAPALSGTDRSRSAVDVAATTALLHAGLDVDEAWRELRDAPGFTRTRGRGRAWWVRYHWNHAVRTDTAWRTHHGETSTAPAAGASAAENRAESRPGSRSGRLTASPATIRAVEAARASLDAAQWRLGPRQRHQVLHVAHTLLDRMLRVDELEVPCPLRDLQVDTGHARPTVLTALQLLGGTSTTTGLLGVRVAAFDHTRADSSSHLFRLHERFSTHAVSLVEPPGLTPTPRAGAFTALPALAHTVWRHLPVPPTPAQTAQPPALPANPHDLLQQLAQASGLTHGPDQSPSPRQRRTLATALGQLRRAGLAVHDGSTWARADTITATHQRRAAATRRQLVDQVAVERRVYRERLWSRWHRDRTRVLRAQRAAQLHRWALLDDLEQARRRRARRVWFERLPLADQAAHKHHLARRRHHAGEPSERSAHAGWCRGFTPADQADRSAAWQHRFAQLPKGEQAARVQFLEDHRRRWSTPTGWSTHTTVDVTPAGATAAA